MPTTLAYNYYHYNNVKQNTIDGASYGRLKKQKNEKEEEGKMVI